MTDAEGHIWAATAMACSKAFLRRRGYASGASSFTAGEIAAVYPFGPLRPARPPMGRQLVWSVRAGIRPLAPFHHAGRPAQNGVTYMGEATDGAMWIAYREPWAFPGSGSRRTGWQFATFRTSTACARTKCCSWVRTGSGRLWVGTDRGLESFDGRRWVHYDTSDGLIWDDCNAAAFFADADGSIWIGTSRGISHFYASGAPPRPTAAPAVLTSASLGTRRCLLSGDATVPYSQRVFHATFAALTFVNEESVRMRYRLVGLDSGWTETDDDDARYAGAAFRGSIRSKSRPDRPRTPGVRPAQFASVSNRPGGCAGGHGRPASCCARLLGRQLWAWRMRSILNRQKALGVRGGGADARAHSGAAARAASRSSARTRRRRWWRSRRWKSSGYSRNRRSPPG